MAGYPIGNYGSSNGYGSSSLSLSWGGLLVGSTGFDLRHLVSDPEDFFGTGFCDVSARRRRYALYWALYENNIFWRIHQWSQALKDKFDLYDAIRSIYSPAYRQGEFWAGHIWGGILDPQAGDGIARPSALPIVISDKVPANLHDPLRSAIARIWSTGYSNWQSNKDTAARLGAVCGDVALAAVDDPVAQRVHIRVVHPRTIKYLEKDDYGNCKAYELEELRPDPREGFGRALVTFREIAERVGDRVVYRTFLDRDEYDWREPYPDGTPDSARTGAVWTEDYGFVPFFHIQHRDMGLGWGWSEYQAEVSKILELEDQASKLHDQIRKIVDPEEFFSGVSGPAELDARDPEKVDEADESDSPRNRKRAIYAKDPAAKVTQLVAPLDIPGCTANIQSLLAEIERDHPELQADMATSSGDASGRALRVARERVEAMVVQRRVGYDDALVRAQQACISIGAMKGYEGFTEFTAESYGLGYLAHSIGDRPVFAVDQMDRLEEGKARADLMKVLVDAGWPVEVAAEEAGYSEDVLGKLKAGMQAVAAMEDRFRSDTGGLGLIQ